MRLALLGPIAWRTPPRAYGPWETVTGLLADGLTRRGVDVTLFATLDSTVRALQPEAKPRILVSDTVGFIKKLPHDLVASFKSTLDEALEVRV